MSNIFFEGTENIAIEELLIFLTGIGFIEGA